MPIVVHAERTFDRPLVIVSFPTQGLVGAIATSYLVPTLKMEMVASMDSPLLPPVVAVRGGRAFAPIQMFASDRECGIDGKCSQLVLVRSEVTPEPDRADAIAQEVMDWVASLQPELVVTFSGAKIPVQEDVVFAVRNLHADVEPESFGAKTYPDGSLGGMSAAFLSIGNARRLPVVALLTGVREEIPDHAAAARLIQAADILIPGIKIDTKPLVAKAAKIERQIRAALDNQQRSVERMKRSADMMYR